MSNRARFTLFDNEFLAQYGVAPVVSSLTQRAGRPPLSGPPLFSAMQQEADHEDYIRTIFQRNQAEREAKYWKRHAEHWRRSAEVMFGFLMIAVAVIIWFVVFPGLLRLWF